MEKRSYRRFTTEQKRTILDETQQPGVRMAEACRKHRVSPGLVYRWRAVAQQATTEALQKVDSRGKTAPDAYAARLEAELKRNRHALSSRQRPDDACAGEAECSGPGWLMPLAPG